MNLKIIVGSTRQGRRGRVVGDWVNEIAIEHGIFDVELLDLLEWNLPMFDAPMPPSTGRYPEETLPWANKIGEGDAYVFVTPEYNYSIPAPLKNAIDHIYREWNNKPMACVSYGGSSGGLRAVQQLRLIAVELQMAPIRAGVAFPLARSVFGDGGTGPTERHIESARSMLDSLAWWAEALAKAKA